MGKRTVEQLEKIKEEKIRLQNESNIGKITLEFKHLEDSILQSLRTKLSETTKKLEESEKKCADLDRRKEDYKKLFFDLKRNEEKSKQALGATVSD